MNTIKKIASYAGLSIILMNNVVLVGSVSADSSPTMQQKNEKNIIFQNNIPKTKNNPSFQNHIDDVYGMLKRMALGLSACMVSQGIVPPNEQVGDRDSNPISFGVGKRYLFINNDIQTKDGSALAAHVTTFENNTDAQMTYTTPNFTYTTTDTTTSTSTQAMESGLTTTTKIDLPGVGGTSIGMTVRFNFSTTQSQTNTQTVTWGVPSQNIPVKPHHKIRVTWLLKNLIATGTANMRDRYSGYIPFRVWSDEHSYRESGYALGATIDNTSWFSNEYWNSYVKDSRKKWHPVVPEPGENMDTADYDTDQATFTAKYGTEMYLKVDDVTQGDKNPKTIDIIPIKNSTRKLD